MRKNLVFVAILFLALQARAEFVPIRGHDLVSGEIVSVAPSNEKKKTVVTFLSSKCPCSKSHVAILHDLALKYPHINFVAVHSNADEDVAQAKSYFSGVNLGFTVLQDEKSQLANRFQALKTPHTFVLGENGDVIYRGGVTSSNYGPTAEHQYLADALSEIAAGQPVKIAEGRTLGCVIAR